MRLLLGPPGSGKSTLILNELRIRLKDARPRAVLLVPTSTMAEHLRNQLAREGLLVRPGVIRTLASFLDILLPDLPQATALDLEMIVGRALDAGRPAALEAVSGAAGLAPALAAAIEELANAGCDSLKWAALRNMNVHSGPLTDALGSVYEHAERLLGESKLHLRAERLNAAASSLRRGAPEELAWVYLDGFFTLNPGELAVVGALARGCDVTVSLPEWPGAQPARARLLEMGFREERLQVRRATAESRLSPALNRHREVEAVALRIRELRAAGAAWRDCVVVVRGAEPYVPLLESAFDRFGIPFRSYFTRPLATHPVARALAGAVAAAIKGFEHSAVLDALRPPVTNSGVCGLYPRFEDHVRQRMPGAGLDSLRTMLSSLPGSDTIAADVSFLAGLEGLTSASLPPADWLAALRALEKLLAPPPADTRFGTALRRQWRTRAAAFHSFFSTLADVARLLGAEPQTLEQFWSEALPAVERAAIRDVDHLRDAVALIDAYESRQWEAPYVFVCGLLEGEFPRRTNPDPILGDELRVRLNRQGVPVRTRDDRQTEEEFLLDLVRLRATRELQLSWPQFNEKGEPTLETFALQTIPGERVPLRPVRLIPRRVINAPGPASIDVPALQDAVAARHETHSATSLEDFLQCPFRFHAAHTLELSEPAPAPAERLDALFAGKVIHRVLAEWHMRGGRIESIFDSVWRRALQRERIPLGHRTEFARIVLLRSLRLFVSNTRIEQGWRVFVEQEIELKLQSARILGRIDRYDVNEASDVRVYDFKNTSSAGLRRRLERQEQGLTLQGGLYALALERQGLHPVSFMYCAVRREPKWDGAKTPEETAELMNEARAKAEDAVMRINAGEIRVSPADPEACAYCSFRDICRIGAGAGEPQIAAAGQARVVTRPPLAP